jgi:hypothetical protein
LPCSTDSAFAQASISAGIEMLVFTYAICMAQLLLPSSKKWQQQMRKKINGVITPYEKNT